MMTSERNPNHCSPAKRARVDTNKIVDDNGPQEFERLAECGDHEHSGATRFRLPLTEFDQNENEVQDESSSTKRARVERVEDGDREEVREHVPQNLRVDESKGAGIIEKISLKNFMCHSRLEVDFSANANFVIGCNGSGKSAIVAALIVGLGGKAYATNRGTSLKDFLKYGKHTADVRIQLKNSTRLDSYKPKEYGSSIIVERRFSRDGSSQYRLKNHKGQIVSTAKQELTRILDHFSIQVDNPVTILNQEASKNFLFSKDPKDKYKFFMKATLMDALRHEICEANEARKTAQDILNDRTDSLSVLHKEVKKWEKKFQSLQCLDKLRNDIVELKNQLAWSYVTEREGELEKAKKHRNLLDSRTPKYTEKVRLSQNVVNELKRKQTEVQNKVVKFGDEGNQLEPQVVVAKRDADEKRKSFRNAVMEQKRMEKALTSNEKDVNAITQRIDELKSSSLSLNEEKRERKLRISQLENEIKKLDTKKKDLELEKEEKMAKVAEKKMDQRQLRTEENEFSRLISSKSGELERKIASKTDKMKKYGDFMPRVLQQIEDAHKKGLFHKKPKGPIGTFLKLKEPEWAVAVECCLKSVMNTFCVHDHHDERVLEKIFKNCCSTNWKPSTITSKFATEAYDVSHGKAQSKYPTVLDMLEVNDSTVRNCLIDQKGIESILLIKNPQEARNIMATRPPKNAREAFVLSGDHMFCSPTFRYYSAPAAKLTASFLTVNVEEGIRSLEAEIEVLKQQLKETKLKYQEKGNEISHSQGREAQIQMIIYELLEEQGRLELEVSDLKNKEEPAPVDIATLEDEVEQYRAISKELQEKLNLIQNDVAVHKNEVEAAEHKHKELHGRLQEIIGSTDPFKEQLAKLETETDGADIAMRHYRDKETAHLNEVVEAQKNVAKILKKLEEETVKAEGICPKMAANRSPKNLIAEIRQIETTVRTEENCQGDPEEIARSYHGAMKQFKDVKHEMAHQVKFLQEFNEAMVRRQKCYEELKTSFAVRARFAFIRMIETRGYSGKISFNHRAQTLNLVVQPNHGSDETEAQDVRSLSGGERSFATLCLVLALWEVVDSPIRCLDEFDVFMDLVNRQISMKMILTVTQNKKDVQFIFLSPLNISYVDPTKVHIFRMPTPERGPSILPRAEEDPEQ